MSTAGGPRPAAQRRRDTEHRLRTDTDLWAATASADGVPHLVPLSFDFEDGAVLVATPGSTPTGRNLDASGAVRLGLGPTRDVTMIEGRAEGIALDALPRERADRFTARTGFDPRAQGQDYRWYRITPARVHAWREADELAGRTLMRDSQWLA